MRLVISESGDPTWPIPDFSLDFPWKITDFPGIFSKITRFRTIRVSETCPKLKIFVRRFLGYERRITAGSRRAICHLSILEQRNEFSNFEFSNIFLGRYLDHNDNSYLESHNKIYFELNKLFRIEEYCFSRYSIFFLPSLLLLP